jgi:hypothetical protein
VKTAIENAVRHAVDVAVSRGGRLRAFTLRSEGDAHQVRSLAKQELERLGQPDVEVHVLLAAGDLHLQSVEVEPGTSRR